MQQVGDGVYLARDHFLVATKSKGGEKRIPRSYVRDLPDPMKEVRPCLFVNMIVVLAAVTVHLAVRQDEERQAASDAARASDPKLYPEAYRKDNKRQSSKTSHDSTGPLDVGLITRILLRSSGPMVDIRVLYRYAPVGPALLCTAWP